MIDFSRLPASSLLGRFLRSVLRVVPLPLEMSVLQGPLRGARWLTASGTHGCWLGTYELSKQRLLSAILRPAQTFYDIGAHAGLYTILGARIVGARGQVVAFEPDLRNYANLQRHILLNQLDNARPVNTAITGETGMVTIVVGHSSYETRLGYDGTSTVPCYSLDDAIAKLSLPPPDCLKIDVEGAEEHVLRGATVTLTRDRPTILLATHAPDIHMRCCERLRAFGYDLRALDGGSWRDTDELVAQPR